MFAYKEYNETVSVSQVQLSHKQSRSKLVHFSSHRIPSARAAGRGEVPKIWNLVPNFGTWFQTGPLGSKFKFQATPDRGRAVPNTHLRSPTRHESLEKTA